VNTSAPEQPRAVSVEFVGGELVVGLADGRSVHVPLAWFPRLEAANREELADWRLVGKGVGIHWPRLDEDLSVSGLLAPQVSARRSNG
jgi:Protein of unknown function (DUF2442)